MAKRTVIWSTVILLLLILVLLRTGLLRHTGTTSRVDIAFLGFTNASPSKTRFALLSIHNANSFPIRWRGNWSEVEGQYPYKAPVFNPRLPWFTSSWELPRGESLTVAVGEPLEIVTKEKERWRFSVQWTRYTLRQRLFDVGFRHPWLMKIPRFSSLQPSGALDATNMVISSGPWLGN